VSVVLDGALLHASSFLCSEYSSLPYRTKPGLG